MGVVPTLERPFPGSTRYLPGDDAPLGVMHIVDRVVGRQFLLGPEEKEYFRGLLFRISAFSGIEVLTWSCLDNHYHLLLRVPNASEAERLRAGLSEEDVLARMEGAFSESYIQEVKWRLAAFRRENKPEMAATIMRRLKAQLFDISAFMHMLKRRFSAWYNQRHERKGTLWEGRFRSVLVEDSQEALLRMAAYIDLNAVRAGLVEDPAEYRWCGYAQAVAGDERAQRGICELVSAECEDDVCWEEARGLYRGWVFADGCEIRDEEGKVVGVGISAEQVQRVQAEGGRLTRGQLLHCRVRYFADGVAIGSRGFVEGVFERYRANFGAKRPNGARPMRYGDWGGLCSLRDLRREVIRAG